jgi:hypothetical protein
LFCIGRDHFDLLAQHRAAEIVDRHLRRDHRALTVDVGVEARHVGQHTELHDIVGDLRRRRRDDRQRHDGAGKKSTKHCYFPC